MRKYADGFRHRPDIAADPEAAVFTTGNLHRLAVWCRSTNTILGIANTNPVNKHSIMETNIQENLDFLPSSAQSLQGLSVALCFVLMTRLSIY